MSLNPEKKGGLLETWKKINYVTLVIAVGIGGTVGLSLAAIDLLQIAGIKFIENRRIKKQ